MMAFEVQTIADCKCLKILSIVRPMQFNGKFIEVQSKHQVYHGQHKTRKHQWRKFFWNWEQSICWFFDDFFWIRVLNYFWIKVHVQKCVSLEIWVVKESSFSAWSFILISLSSVRQKSKSGVVIVVANERRAAETQSGGRMRKLAEKASPRLRNRTNALRTTSAAQCYGR